MYLPFLAFKKMFPVEKKSTQPKCQKKEKVPSWMSEVSVRGGAQRLYFAAAVLVSILPTLEQKALSASKCCSVK